MPITKTIKIADLITTDELIQVPSELLLPFIHPTTYFLCPEMPGRAWIRSQRFSLWMQHAHIMVSLSTGKIIGGREDLAYGRHRTPSNTREQKIYTMLDQYKLREKAFSMNVMKMDPPALSRFI